MKKRILALMLVCCLMLLCACAPQPVATEPTGTDATETGSTEPFTGHYPVVPDPTQPEEELKEKPDFSNVNELEPNASGVYQIHSKEGLANMAKHPDGKFELLWDIDLEGETWTPVGTQEAPFTGSFDGKEYKISNLVINTAADGNTGFFGVNQGTVQNLKLNGVQISTNAGYAGVLAGVNAGTLENCSANGSLLAAAGTAVAGGLVGKAETGVITGCQADVRIEAEETASVGLLGGELKNVTLSGCMYTGSMNRKGGKLFTNLAAAGENVTYTDCLWRDNTNSSEFLSEEAQQMRHRVEQEMRAMGSVEWTVDENLSYFHTSGSTLHTQFYFPGVTYKGLPYTGKDGGMDRFLYCFNEDGTLKDFAKQNPVGADNFDMYMGNDCSGAIYWAWSTVSTTTNWRWTQNMLGFQGEGGIPVGEYEGAWDMDDTMAIMKANGEQKIAEAYAKLRKGDACTTYYTNPDNTDDHQGHARMMATDPVVMRNTDGTIDLNKSYFNTHEQGDGLYNYVNSTWIIDGTYTFKTFFDNNYAPLSCQELLDGKQQECVVTIDNEETGKAYMTTGIVETNYRLSSVTIKITDEAGEPVWEKTLFTSVDKFANTNTDYIVRTTARSFDIAAFAAYIGEAELESGKTYNYELIATPGNRQNYTLKTFTFVN